MFSGIRRCLVDEENKVTSYIYFAALTAAAFYRPLLHMPAATPQQICYDAKPFISRPFIYSVEAAIDRYHA